jgi:hypothetical protein
MQVAELAAVRSKRWRSLYSGKSARAINAGGLSASFAKWPFLRKKKKKLVLHGINTAISGRQRNAHGTTILVLLLGI